MGQRRAGHINRCPNCRVNQFFCVCSFIKPLMIQTQVSLIVHVRELKLTSNTAQFANKMLPHQSHMIIRGRVHDTFNAASVLKTSGRPLFLYPHHDAQVLDEHFVKEFPGPYHLIVPDGNWQQARKVRQREEEFKHLPAVKLPENLRSEYGLRKAFHPDWLSTYEAMAHALGILESPKITDELMSFFRIWVDRTNRARSGDFSS
jgi:DTW domain-containing protein